MEDFALCDYNCSRQLSISQLLRAKSTMSCTYLSIVVFSAVSRFEAGRLNMG